MPHRLVARQFSRGVQASDPVVTPVGDDVSPAGSTNAILRASVLKLEKCTQNLSHASVVSKLEQKLQDLRAELSAARRRTNLGEQTELELTQRPPGGSA